MITENYDYIAELEFDKKTKLYNLFISTFNGLPTNINLLVFFCTRRHRTRLDLVSNDIYGTTKWTGTLCEINNMFHPHQVRNGDVLIYLPESAMNDMGVVPEAIKQSGELVSRVKSDLINALKNKRPDPIRAKFDLNRNDSDALPPTVLDSNAPQIQVDNNKIEIAPNLFKNPKVEASEPIDLSTPNDDLISNTQEDSTERVLVRRYIKTLDN